MNNVWERNFGGVEKTQRRVLAVELVSRETAKGVSSTADA